MSVNITWMKRLLCQNVPEMFLLQETLTISGLNLKTYME